MNINHTALAALLALALSACGGNAPDKGAQGTAAAPATGPAAAEHDKDSAMTALKPPSADSVLYVIYQRDGDGAVSYKVDGGAIVSYWYGQVFDLKGKHYFTGFTSKTEGEEGPDAEAGMMEPGNVAIGQATFVQGGTADAPAWVQLDTDGYVGEFGRNDQPEPLDTARKAQTHALEDGRMLLAVPTRDFNEGVAMSGYAIFLFDPDNVDKLSFRRWGYLGSIHAGDDNSASCEDGAVTPCAVSTGTLAFGAVSGGLPTLTVSLSGKTIDGPGKLRDLGPADTLTYTFNADKERYAP